MFQLLCCSLILVVQVVFGRRKASGTTCKYADSYDLSVDGSTEISERNMVGRVSIGDSFSVEFSLVVNSLPDNEWVSILHVGESNTERSPGIWLWPSSTKLHVCLSDIDNWNTYNDFDESFELGVAYQIKLTVSSAGQVTAYLDGVQKFQYNDTIPLTRFRAPVFIGDPWYTAVNGTVTDLVIESFDDSCASSSSSSSSYDNLESLSFSSSGLVDNNGNKSFELVFEPWQMIIVGVFAILGVFACWRWMREVHSSTKGKNLSGEYSKIAEYGTA